MKYIALVLAFVVFTKGMLQPTIVKKDRHIHTVQTQLKAIGAGA